MTRFDQIEREMPLLLDQLAGGPAPDYVDEVLGLTAATSQRAPWTFVERWLPMSAVTFRSAVGPVVPVRLILTGALLLLGLVAWAILLAGAQRPDVPNLFEPGRSGFIAYEIDGDIYTGDPATGAVTPLVTGPSADRRPTWSLDGRRLAFVRLVDGGQSQNELYVVGAAGGRPTLVRPDPFALVTGLAWAPDGASILVNWIRGYAQVLSLVDVATGATTDVPFDGSAIWPAFRPPDGREILFVGGDRTSSIGQGIYAYDVAAGSIRTIVDPTPSVEVDGWPSWSPDGSQVAFALWDPAGAMLGSMIVPAEGGTPRSVPAPDGIAGDGSPVWSHDGSRLVLIRTYEGREVVALVDPREGGLGTEVEVPGIGCASMAWSPDDAQVLVLPFVDCNLPGEQILIDTRTGRIVPLAWGASSDPAWQRLEP